MALPLDQPLPPQLARSRAALPEGPEWAYEPKWDGFRCVAFVDGDAVELQSRSGRPLTRYFPELRFPDERCVLDGEIVRFDEDGRQDFNALGQRIHPAASRVELLSNETPVRFIAFDLLAEGDESLLELPYERRRERLERLIARLPDDRIDITPTTRELAETAPWLSGGEGVIAKEVAAPYLPGERTGMVKVKRVRTMDCVVRGWRPGKEEGTVGSLILSLYDPDGQLRVIGFSAGFKAADKRTMVDRLAPYETGHRGTAEPSRWAGDKDLQWVELRPELVVEVSFDHASNGRIRHSAKILRWRDDKPPAECTLDQLDQ